MVTMHQRQRKAWQDTQPREIEPKDLLRHYPTAWPSCTSNCDQGRKLCPCPAACMRPDDETSKKFSASSVAIWTFGVAIGVICIAAGWHFIAAFIADLRT